MNVPNYTSPTEFENCREMRKSVEQARAGNFFLGSYF